MSSIARFDTWQAADGTNVARYNAGVLETWDGSAWVQAGVGTFEYLVIAGGAGGARGASVASSEGCGGGGAGGYRSSISGESSGGGGTAESPLSLSAGDSFNVIVGAGGAGATSDLTRGGVGSTSLLYTVVAVGGGQSGYSASVGLQGGSGGGGGASPSIYAGGQGIPLQGYAGGSGGGNAAGGGGGGAGQAGDNGETEGSQFAGDGGDGVASSVTGSSVTRGGGGGGGAYYSGKQGQGGVGGGGNGASYAGSLDATAGAANTGGGGGGGSVQRNGAAGGSGVVILKYPVARSLTIGAGLTSTTSTIGDYKVTVFTAGSDSVTVS